MHIYTEHAGYLEVNGGQTSGPRAPVELPLVSPVSSTMHRHISVQL